MSSSQRAAMRPVHIDNVRLAPAVVGDAAIDIDIVFDVGWEDSWREVPDIADGTNWDAVWICVKLKVDMSFSLPQPVAQALWDAVLSEDFASVIAAIAASLPTAASHLTVLSQDHNYKVSPDPSRPWALTLNLVPTTVHEAVKDDDDRPTITLIADSPLDEGTGPKSFSMNDDTGHWQQAYLSPDPAHYYAPEGCTIAPAPDGVGVFIYRSSSNTGHGPVRFEDVALRWPVAGPGDDDDVIREVQMWIHAIPMVYIAEGPFWLGDPAGRAGPTGCFFDAAKSGPYQVTSEAAIEAANASKTSGLAWQDRENTPSGDVPAAFPKGYQGFFCMRGHVTQGEYCDFINSLRGEAITLHYPYLAEGNFRFTLYKGATRNRVASRPLRPCNFLSWTDAVAYLWWIGLRPMSELEFEKACRGPLAPLAQEYAWGSATIERAQVIVGDEASGTEAVDGNCHTENAEIVLRGGDGGNGPVRCGAFARPGKPNTDWIHPTGRVRFTRASPRPIVPNIRELTGTSYYGVECLSGNLWEFVVNVSYPEGRAFTGDHGNGCLNKAGGPGRTHDVWANSERAFSISWPASDGVGMGFRGGAFYTPARRARVADRYYAMGLTGYVMRSQDTGCRGVRSMPPASTDDGAPPASGQR